jgi:hypothetical protein
MHLALFPVHAISGPIPTYIVSCSVYQARKAPKPRMSSFPGGMISGTGLAEPVDCLSAWPAGKVCFSRVEEDNDPARPGHRCIAESGPIVAHSPSPPLGRARKPVFHFWRCRRANIYSTHLCCFSAAFSISAWSDLRPMVPFARGKPEFTNAQLRGDEICDSMGDR